MVLLHYSRLHCNIGLDMHLLTTELNCFLECNSNRVFPTLLQSVSGILNPFIEVVGSTLKMLLSQALSSFSIY